MDLFSKRKAKYNNVWQTGFRFAFLVVIVTVLSTVFIVERFMWQGVTTAKYFWFVIAVCYAVVCWCVTLFFGVLRIAGKLSLADIVIGLLFLYICGSYLLLNGNPSMHWWLFLLMIPLYAVMRTACANRLLKRFILDRKSTRLNSSH